MGISTKLCVIFFSFLWALPSSAQTKSTDIIHDPKKITFESLLCGSNVFENPVDHIGIKSICWLRSRQSYEDLEFPEALKVTFLNGDEQIFHLAPFVFDTRLSRTYSSQILRATLRGELAMGTHVVSTVYKEYALSSRLTREDKPVKIYGTLPSGHKFIVNSF
jgi:hypothetical protein